MQTALVVDAKFIDNQTIHINEPIDAENKDIYITIHFKDKEKTKNKNFYFGCMKDHITISDDFNEPLDEFREYM